MGKELKLELGLGFVLGLKLGLRLGWVGVRVKFRAKVYIRAEGATVQG